MKPAQGLIILAGIGMGISVLDVLKARRHPVTHWHLRRNWIYGLVYALLLGWGLLWL